MAYTLPAVNPDWSLSVVQQLATDFADANTVLQSQQVGVESDTGRFKIGDGVTAWNDLEYGMLTAGADSVIFVSSDADNLLRPVNTVSEKGYKLPPAMVNFFSAVDDAWQGITTDITTLNGEPQKLAPAFLGLVARRIVLEALGADYMNVINHTAPTQTVSDRLTALEAAITNTVETIGFVIDDTTPSSTGVYSSNKIESLISTKFSSFVGAAPGSLDTIYEIAAAFGNDPSYVSSVATQVDGCINTWAQGLTLAQQTQARANIGAVSALDQGQLSDFDTWNDVLTNLPLGTAVANKVYTGTTLESTRSFKNYVGTLLDPIFYFADQTVTPVVTVPEQVLIFTCVRSGGSLTVSANCFQFVMPFDFDLTQIKFNLATPQTSGALLNVALDISTLGGTSGGYGNGANALALPLPGPAPHRVRAGTRLTVSVSQVGDGTAKGLTLSITGRAVVDSYEEYFISEIFAKGTQGAWYVADDFYLLDQATGSTPVTAFEQSIGMRKDKSPWGFHSYQSNATLQPKVSARLNLFTESEVRNGVSDLADSTGFTAVAANNWGPAYVRDTSGWWNFTTAVASAGGATEKHAYKNIDIAPQAMYYTISVHVQMADLSRPAFNSTDATTDFDLVINGGVTPSSQYKVSAEINNVYKVSYAYTSTLALYSGDVGLIQLATNSGKAFTTTGFDLRPSWYDHLPYQYVNTATLYDTNSVFPRYFAFDGVDDVLVTTFPAALGANCTVARALLGTGASFVEGPLTATFNDSTPSCATLVFNRLLTTAEKAVLTTYLNKKARLPV